MKKLILTFGCALLLAACSSETKKEKEEGKADDVVVVDPTSIENTATSENPDVNQADLPVLTFEKEIHEFPGEIMEGEKVSYAFKFTNTGKSPLIISEASAPCGCTVPQVSKEPIAPGESSKIDVIFSSEGKPGRNEKAIKVVSNAIPKTRELRIVVNVKPKAQQGN